MTRYPAFIVRAVEAKLRDALDLANDRLLRYQDENVRLTRENVTLRRKLDEAEVARDAALDAWVVAASERDEERGRRIMTGGYRESKMVPVEPEDAT